MAEIAGAQKGIAGLNTAAGEQFGLRQHLDEETGVETVRLDTSPIQAGKLAVLGHCTIRSLRV